MAWTVWPDFSPHCTIFVCTFLFRRTNSWRDTAGLYQLGRGGQILGILVPRPPGDRPGRPAGRPGGHVWPQKTHDPSAAGGPGTAAIVGKFASHCPPPPLCILSSWEEKWAMQIFSCFCWNSTEWLPDYSLLAFSEDTCVNAQFHCYVCVYLQYITYSRLPLWTFCNS